MGFPPSMFRSRNHGNASVAQGIEHRSPKAGVVRSNRIGGTIKNSRSEDIFL